MLVDGLALATAVGHAVPRCPLVVTSTMVESATYFSSPGRALRCLLDDGTGQIELLFTGRSEIQGLAKGALARVEGTTTSEDGRLMLWNPIYRLDEPGPT